jgi:hypothetical protein
MGISCYLPVKLVPGAITKQDCLHQKDSHIPPIFYTKKG